MEEEKIDAQENNELEDLKNKCDDYLNGWKRAKADFINYQKGEAKRFEEFAQFANESIMRNFIAILDSFDLALDLPNADKGLRIIRSQCEDVLKKHGLETIHAQPGEPFSPALHEAIATAENAEGVIAEVMRAGYTLYGKVIRPAQVKIK